MKTDDQVIDKLMRRHAALRAAQRRPKSPMESSYGEHLDADELSAFAENALPASTRSRYISHLADCERCRRIMLAVSTATTTSPAALAEKSREPAAAANIVGDASPGWRQYLQSLFSFPTLRFALPVLTFLAIAGVVWRVYEPLRSANFPVSNRETSEPAMVVSSGSNIVREQAPAKQFSIGPTGRGAENRSKACFV
ncbi:MAG: zf-HC2 domain-containing protein [Pyrinomonadaceae bacterium]